MTKSRGTKAITAILIITATVLSFSACEAEEQLIETAGTTTTEVTVEAPVQETSAEDFNYSEIDGGIRIDKYTENDKEVVIPAMIDGKPVTMIGDSALQQNETVESVTIPDSVEVIGERAFMLC
ncbi:MAG: leucine-rich repeat domain-containing protein, partial [Ruminiclostridium sp.]|nr:leucine-rich repeat domain-containing protein [Ruminiclostridium sp.]